MGLYEKENSMELIMYAGILVAFLGVWTAGFIVGYAVSKR